MWFWIGSALFLFVSFLIFRIPVRNDYLVRGKLSWSSAGLETLVFALHANLPYLYLRVKWPGVPPLPVNRFQVWISLGISVLGIIMTLGIMVYLGFITSLGQGSAGIRQTGPYQWTRNPQLLSYSLALIGLAALYPSVESVTWILLYGVIAQVMVLTEEEYLTSTFGNAYLEYCARVPRYICFGGQRKIIPNTLNKTNVK